MESRWISGCCAIQIRANKTKQQPTFSMASVLKYELHSDLLAPRRQAATNCTCGRGPDDCVGIVEVGVVQRVEHFPPECQPHSLLNRKLAVNSSIQVEIPRAEDNPVPRVAKCVLRGNSEGGRI